MSMGSIDAHEFLPEMLEGSLCLSRWRFDRGIARVFVEGRSAGEVASRSRGGVGFDGGNDRDGRPGRTDVRRA